MFTGIIEAVQPLISLRQSAGKTLITLGRPAPFDDLKTGASLACNGICLTVTAFDARSFTVEVMQETVKKTTAAHWQTGEPVNLERALRLGDRLDGHWVQGHVDTTASLLERKTVRETLYLTFALPSEYKWLIVPQGSIAVNGVSLTVANLQTGRFSVALIGHTLSLTNLAQLTLGKAVNLEFDILGKYLLRQQETNSLNEEWLHEQGY